MGPKATVTYNGRRGAGGKGLQIRICRLMATVQSESFPKTAELHSDFKGTTNKKTKAYKVQFEAVH